ncbi:MAG: alpha/beta hydrolase [bacterium]|nr:alpha/beta hydrolase [bacterium]
MQDTELGSNEIFLTFARAVVLLGGILACLWQWAFYLFVIIYALGVASYMLQRNFLYRPAKRPYRSPFNLHLSGVHEVWLNTTDGEQILTWQIDPWPGMPTILYLHGNNCNLSNRLERVSRFLRDGYGLVMPSFRGYGVSTGRPSEQNNVNDALLAFEKLQQNGVPSANIIVYGESLGTGVAVQVAARRSIGALVLEAPYTSLRDLVRHRIRVIPAYTFLKDRFNSIKHIKKVTAPLLIVHSLGDDVIPIAFGRWLFEAATGTKEFLRMRGAGHSGLFRAGAWLEIREFVEEHVASAGKYGVQAREAAASNSQQVEKMARNSRLAATRS